MIYYSHVNEDNNIERNICFQNKPSTIFCITGSGERLISLLDAPQLKMVLAIDNNQEAQYLLELKLKALEYLDVDQYLKFIGFFEDQTERLKIFDQLSNKLTEASLKYWNEHLAFVKKGLLNIGHFESYMGNLRPITKWFLGKGFNDCFKHDLDKCSNFPYIRWNFLLKMLSSNYFFHFTGNRDIAFTTNDCDNKRISIGIRETLLQNRANDSFMFNLIFKGHLRGMNPTFLPPSLQPEILTGIKTKLINKEIVIKYITRDLRLAISENVDCIKNNTFFSFSDILSFTDPEYISEILHKLNNIGKTQLIGVFRSFLRNDIEVEEFSKELLILIKDISDQEITFMYKAYHFSI